MPLRNKDPIQRPDVEKKFSLKNPQDRAILISFGIILMVVIIILVLIIAFGGLF